MGSTAYLLLYILLPSPLPPGFFLSEKKNANTHDSFARALVLLMPVLNRVFYKKGSRLISRALTGKLGGSDVSVGVFCNVENSLSFAACLTYGRS